ncbi:MAG: hypothetical protein JXB25_06430 [Deltaproteobacteria bacterium]|nr:hypothetical protein [Deltaproteobacteria bacterium]
MRRQAAPVSNGEVCRYDIGVLKFDRVGEAEFRFEEIGEGRFRAVLAAATMGIAAKLSGHRRQTYQTVMERGPDGKYRPLRFEYERTKKNGSDLDVQVKRYDFDYQQRLVRYLRIKNGRAGRGAVWSMGEGSAPADFLTGFVNFRSGFYGHPAPGHPLSLPTFVRGGASEIRIEAAGSGVSKQRDFFRECPGLFRVILDPEVFDTGGGAVFVCLDGENRLLRGAVENVLGMGDVLGEMRSEQR